jgi:hypothetical protein
MTSLSCDVVQERVLLGAVDESAEIHLKTCTKCQQLVVSHREALGLRGVVPLLRSKVNKRTVLIQGAMAAAALLIIPAVAVGTWTQGRRGGSATSFEQRVVGPSDEAAEWASVATFVRTLEADFSRSVASNDPSYVAFGTLGAWVAPGSTLSQWER